MDDVLEQRLLAVSQDTAALARELGHAELAEKVDTKMARSADREVTVVVVGEKKRGKSSLINALIGVRDLLPVEADVATSCYLTIRSGPEPKVVATDAEHPDGIEIGPGEIAEYASVEGNRDPEDDDQVLHEGVTAVDVRLDHPLLRRGLVLVDTPGVGGLEAGHTEITLATLRRADALVFVVDPDSPLKASELRFLSRATERIATVLFVITKTDLYAGWQQILSDNRELLAHHGPTLADRPWIPVSSELGLEAAAAAEAGHHDRSAGLRRRSGLDELERHLVDDVVDRADVLELANVLQSAASTLDRMARAEEARIRAATGDPRLVDELDAKQDVLRRLTQANATWKRQATEEFRRLETDLQRTLQRRVRELRRQAEDRIDGGAPGFVEALERDTPAQLQAAWIEVTTVLQEGVAALMLSLTREFENDGVEPLTFDLEAPKGLASVPPISRAGPADSLADNLPAALMGFGGASAGATALGAVGITFPPLLIVGAGVALAHFIFGERTRRSEQQRTQRELKVWVGRVCEDAAFEMAGKLRDRLAELPSTMEAFFVSRLEAKRTEVEREIADAKQRVRADQAERARERADAERRLRRIDELATAVAEGVEAIDRPRTATPNHETQSPSTRSSSNRFARGQGKREGGTAEGRPFDKLRGRKEAPSGVEETVAGDPALAAVPNEGS